MDDTSSEEILKGILKKMKDIDEEIKACKDHTGMINNKIIDDLAEINRKMDNFVLENYHQLVDCPLHHVPMIPVLVPDGNGDYKLCYHDNHHNHFICPKC
jgi:hypothetical protein